MEIELSIHDSVGRVTLNRPEVHNAISRSMWDALPGAMGSLAKQGARVIVVTGQGSSFASGADLQELEQLSSYEEAREHWLSIRNALNAIASFELPVVAAINGPCLGGGCLLSIACDLRYCVPEAVFGIPAALLGIVLDDDNIRRLVRLVGPANAAEMIFSGARLTAQKAQSIALVQDVLPKGELEPFVMSLARRIKDNSAESIRQTKISIGKACQSLSAGGQDEQDLQVSSYLSEEFRRRLEQSKVRD